MRSQSKTASLLLWLFLTAAVSISLVGLVPPLARAGGSTAPRDGDEVLPLTQFLASVRAAQYGQYAAHSGVTVADNAAFAEMKAYILDRYENIDVHRIRYYVVDAAGSIFDCLPQSNSTNLPPTPPRLPGDLGAGERLARQDPVISCPPGTIPVQRVTLETLVRFPHLRDFFHK